MSRHDDQSSAGPVSDWMLERLAAGELPRAQAAALRARLDRDGELDRLAALEASNRAVLEAHPPGAVMAEVRRRAHAAQAAADRRRDWAGRMWLPALSLAAAGTLALLLFMTTGSEPVAMAPLPATGDNLDGDRAKGSARIVVYRREGGDEKRLAPGTPVHPGDTLQVRYHAGGQRYGMIASVDATGGITLHLPEQGERAEPLQASGKTPSSFQLDDSTGFEAFILITADRVFDLAHARDVLAGSATSAHDLPLRVYKVRFPKVSR